MENLENATGIVILILKGGIRVHPVRPKAGGGFTGGCIVINQLPVKKYGGQDLPRINRLKRI
jgi:hypothetical protein